MIGADLHRHLDGSLRYDTLVELLAEQGRSVPEALHFTPGMGLADALARFALTLSVLETPAAVRRVAREMVLDAQADGVSTLEVRFAPQLHGPAPEVFVEAAAEGLNAQAGLILCALYGDPPELVERLVDIGLAHPAVVGIDLAGGPVPGATFGLLDYAPAFRRARDGGLGRTVHAGEGHPAREIREAIEALHAQRIGHGLSLLDDAEVLELVLEREVVIEACPTSNVHTGIIARVADHPLPRWLELGVRACINTDNTLFSNVTWSEELARVAAIDGMTRDRLNHSVAVGHAAAFGPFSR